MDNKNKYISLRDCRFNTRVIMDNRYIRLFFAAYILPFLLLLNGCTIEHLDVDDKDGSATIYLNLDVPGLNSGQNSAYSPVYNSGSGYPSTLRAMSAENESSIDYRNIHVLVFEDVGTDELFRYRATITASDHLQLTLTLPVSRAQERYRIVVVANADVPFIADGTPKNEAMNSIVFDCVGKWNTSDASFAHIPMWGENKQPFAIKDDMSVNILLHRALARVDIGSLFKFNNPNPVNGQVYADRDTDKESVWGLGDFKIKDMRVYRTLNKAFVTTSVDKIAADVVVIPNIPPSAKYNSDSGIGIDDLKDADNNPLVYTLPTGSDRYIREIYIPESFPSGVGLHADNVPCIVVGGYYGENNTTHVTYYRADFASYSNGKVQIYSPLLRNHRYVFDIRSVSGAGHNEPEQALKSITSDMTLDVKEWNEVPLNYSLLGSYFFSIDAREVTLEASPSQGATAATIAYRTNIDLVANPFTYKWISSGNTESNDFDITFDYTAKTITITAKNDNVSPGAQPLSTQVEITVKNYLFTIDVTQKTINN